MNYFYLITYDKIYVYILGRCSNFTMEKGWNYEYLKFKKIELQTRLEKIENLEQRHQIEEDIDMCDYLTTILLFSEGEIIDSNITVKDFVDEIYQQDFSYPMLVDEQKKIETMALSFLNLPRLKIGPINHYISLADSIQIVGDFVKDQFHDKHYQLFQDIFVNRNTGYILFDSNAELSDVTLLDGEMFVRIQKSNNIKMLSSIAHEMGHLYRISNNSHPILTNFYHEYESFFYELHLLLWLIQNNIYSKDAANYFLQLFDLLEKVSYIRYCIQTYQLNQIASSKQFIEEINKLHLKRDLHIRKNKDFFNWYITTMDMDLQTYLYSFMAVLNHMDDFDCYEQVVKAIKNHNEDILKSKILTKNKDEYQSYLKYRDMVQNLC